MLPRTVIGLMLCAIAAGAADVSGKWSGFPAYFVFKQAGTMLTGSVGSPTEQYPFEEGTIDGNQLSFKLGRYQADLHLEGDTIQGTMTGRGETVKIFLKRVDESALPRAFDVASVKRSAPATRTSSTSDPGRIATTNRTLTSLIGGAYRVKAYQVIGPDWLKSETYDITATYPAGSPPEGMQPMMQALLAERFKLEVHRETKELSVYALLVDKGGLKLKSVDPFDSGGFRFSAAGKVRQLSGNISLNQLADALGFMDRPVINLTGVKGPFAVKLEFMPDEARPNAAADSADGPSIYTALHEAGLKLEARKAPVEILVVDRAEKIPVEN